MKFYNIKSNRIISCMAFLVLTIFCSCQDEDLSVEEFTTPTDSFGNLGHGPNESNGDVVTIQWQGEPLRVIKIGNEYFNDDQQVVPDQESGFSAKSAGRLDRIWPNNIVYYVISNSLTNKKRVTNAINHWQIKTNVRFVERRNQKAYIEFVEVDGFCSSSVGRTGARQAISLDPRCTTGSVIHEIGHAVGLFHEQSRNSRDKFIKINFQNVEEGKRHNFDTWKARGFNGKDLTTKLDFSSIMMYDSYAFSKNGKPTITTKENKDYNIQRRGLSAGDVRGIANLYPKIDTSIGTDEKTILLRANNSLYVSSENGIGDITVNRKKGQSWERFVLVSFADGLVAFRGNNGKYLSIEKGTKPMTCNRDEARTQEKFTLEKLRDNKYYIRGHNGLYVSSNNGKPEKGVTCDRSRKGSQEIFTIEGL